MTFVPTGTHDYVLAATVSAPLLPGPAGNQPSQWHLNITPLVSFSCIYNITSGIATCTDQVGVSVTGGTSFDLSVQFSGYFQYDTTTHSTQFFFTSDLVVTINSSSSTRPVNGTKSVIIGLDIGYTTSFFEFDAPTGNPPGSLTASMQVTSFTQDGITMTGWRTIAPTAQISGGGGTGYVQLTDIPYPYTGAITSGYLSRGIPGEIANGTFSGDGSFLSWDYIYPHTTTGITFDYPSGIAIKQPSPNLPAPSPSISFCNLVHSDGSYYRVGRWFTGSTVEGLAIWRGDAGHSRSGYPWDLAGQHVTANPVDDNPCLAIDRAHRLYLVFDRQSSAGPPRVAPSFEMHSDDDGFSWSTATAMLITNGQYPRIRCSDDNSIYRAAYVDDGTGHSTGLIKGQYQAPGDPSPSTVFTFKKLSGLSTVNIAVQQGAFDIFAERDSSNHWILTCLETGNTQPTEYISADDGGGTWIATGT